MVIKFFFSFLFLWCEMDIVCSPLKEGEDTQRWWNTPMLILKENLFSIIIYSSLLLIFHTLFSPLLSTLLLLLFFFPFVYYRQLLLHYFPLPPSPLCLSTLILSKSKSASIFNNMVTVIFSIIVREQHRLKNGKCWNREYSQTKNKTYVILRFEVCFSLGLRDQINMCAWHFTCYALVFSILHSLLTRLFNAFIILFIYLVMLTDAIKGCHCYYYGPY